MARYVLIEFDDDAKADALCAQIDTASANGKPFRIAGLFQKPLKYCTCPEIPLTQYATDRARGAKYGWVVHRECRRPVRSTQWPQNMREPERTEPMFRIEADGSLAGNYPVGVPRDR